MNQMNTNERLGRIQGLSNADYHGGPGVSSTELKYLLQSFAHWEEYHRAKNEERQKRESGEAKVTRTKDAKDKGSLVHALILEPHTVESEFACMPEKPEGMLSNVASAKAALAAAGAATKATKAEDVYELVHQMLPEAITPARWEERLAEMNRKKTLLHPDDWQSAHDCAASVLNHPVAGEYFTGGFAEESFYVADPASGLLRKCRLDYLRILPHQLHVVDLKTIRDAGGDAVIYPTVNDQRPEELTVAPLKEKEAELVRQRVRALKDHPALLAWYLADEPEYHRVLPESVEQLRALISEEDPWHPTIVVNNAFQAIRQFAQGGDVTAPDPYPFFKKGGVSSSMDRVGTFVAEAASCIRPGQTAWVVPQAHDTQDFGGKGERAPTFAESRNMVWQAVAAGARGVVWWDWNWVAPNTIDSVLGNAYLARELNALKSYVLAPVEGGVEITAPEKSMVRAALRTANGQKALFATNASTKAQEVVIKVPALAGRELIVLGEDRTVKVGADGAFTDRFDVYGTHVYVTDAALAKSETLASVQKKIDEGNAALKQPGNLAFEDSGVMIRSSSQGLYQPTPVWMLDGVRDGRGWKAKPFEGADWVELYWSKPQKIGRVVIYTDAIADCEVVVATGNDSKSEWRSLTSVKAATTNPIELTFEQTEVTRIRINISRLREGIKTTRIWEIEAY
jgi:hypothetical protein